MFSAGNEMSVRIWWLPKTCTLCMAHMSVIVWASHVAEARYLGLLERRPDLLDQMHYILRALYDILLKYQKYSIWTIRIFKSHLVLKVQAVRDRLAHPHAHARRPSTGAWNPVMAERKASAYEGLP